jgi:hypothetical protein
MSGIQSDFQSFRLPNTLPTSQPGPLAVDPGGNVWLVDKGARELVKSTAGLTISNFPDNAISVPNGIAIDSAGNILVTNVDNNGNKGVVELAPDGTVISVPGGAFNGGRPAATGGPLGQSNVASFPLGS